MAFPQDPNELTVWMQIDTLWTEITRIDDDTRVLGIGGANAFTITPGQTGFSGRPTPTTISFDYLDVNGLFNEFNGSSPFYRKVPQFTPIRIELNGEILYTFLLVSIEPKVGKDSTIVTFTIAGPMRRYNTGRKFKRPLRSVAYRTIMAPDNDSNRLEYWPLEESTNADRFESLDGAIQPSYAGTINFGAYTGYAVSERMATFGSADALMFFTIRDYDTTPAVGGDDEHKLITFWKMPDAGELADGTVLIRLYTSGTGANIWDFVYGTGGSVRLVAYLAGNGTPVGTNGPWAFDVDSKRILISIELEQDGANVDTTISISGPDYDTPGGSKGVASVQINNIVVGKVTNVVIGQSDIQGCSVGHVAFANDRETTFDNFGLLASGTAGVLAYAGEPAGSRFTRLAAEEGIDVSVLGEETDTELMGPQTTKPPLDQLFECVEVDSALLMEHPINLTLVMKTRVYLMSQAPAVTVDISQISRPLKPVMNDTGRMNDVTAKRPGGSVARYSIPDDDPYHYTTQDPPDGMGPVEGQIEPNVASDDQLIHQAAWAAHHGSWRAPRWADLKIELHRASVASDAALVAALKAMTPGDLIRVTTSGAPLDIAGWIPPYDFFLIPWGWRERIGQFQHEYEITATDGLAWDVEVSESSGSLLVLPIDADDTSLLVETTSGGEWDTDGEDFFIHIAEDAMKVTSISTNTPSFIGVGTASHGTNSNTTPTIHGSTQVGDLMLCFAAIRNFGTGTVNTPTGWTQIRVGGSVSLLARYFQTGDTAPTITYSGGTATTPTSAQIATFRGVSMRVTAFNPLAQSGTDVTMNPIAAGFISGHYRENSLALRIAWRQDDFSASTPPASFTEISEFVTTNGDDQGMTWAYAIQTTPTSIATGTFTITGSSAVAWSDTITLRPLQTLTVTRDINDNAASHLANTSVEVWRGTVNAL